MKEKLKSSHGASIAIGLLYFLICAMVSAVLMTAAKANFSRVIFQRQQEARYLAVVSAAELLKDEMAACQAEAELSDGPRSSAADDGTIEGYKESLLSGLLASAENQVQKAVRRAVYQTYLDAPASGSTLAGVSGNETEFAFTLTGAADAAPVPEVHVTLTAVPDTWVMNSAYAQQFRVKTECRMTTAGDTEAYNLVLAASGLVSFYLEEIEHEEVINAETGETRTTYEYNAHAVISMDRPLMEQKEKTQTAPVSQEGGAS